MRVRNWYLFIVCGIILTLLFLLDPDNGMLNDKLPFGAVTVTTLIAILRGVFGVCLLHISRKMIFDYGIADFKTMLTVAMNSSEGAGRAAMAMGIQTLAIAIVLAGVFLSF